MNSKPFIKLFKTNNINYMYDVNKNVILSISENQYKFLENYVENDINDCSQLEKIENLYKDGFLSSNRVKEIENPFSELLSFELENNLRMIVLQVTQQCNFRCEYCAFSGEYLNRTHSSKKMSISTALKGIDFLIDHSKNNQEISIGFYGGEPILEFDLIKKCVEYAEKKAEGKKIKFYMTTNGYLLSDEIVEFFYNHGLVLTISLDGPREIHDSHRKLAVNNSGSFDKVIENFRNIRDKFPEYIRNIHINAVIDTQNDFSVIDEFFLNCEDINDLIFRSGLISNTNKKSSLKESEDYHIKVQYELFRIFYYLIRKKDTKNCSRIVMDRYHRISKLSELLVPQKPLSEKAHPSGQCVPGIQKLFMNADGFFFPCEKISECSEIMKMGHIDTGINIDKAKKILNPGKVNEDACKNCWAIRFCEVCAVQIDSTEKEFSKAQKDDCCKKVRASLEEKFKNYCFLKEFGHSFERNEEITVFND